MCEVKDYKECKIRRGIVDSRRKIRWLIDNPSRYSDQYLLVLKDTYEQLNLCEERCLKRGIK